MRTAGNFGSLIQTVDKRSAVLTQYKSIKIPYNLIPWKQQAESFDAFYKKGIRNQIKCAHRRYGKDRGDFNLLIGAAIQDPGLYLYLFPEAKQLKRAVWRAIDPITHLRLIDQIPSILLARPANNSELLCELKNGSIIQFSGTDNYDSLRGLDAKGCLWSEIQKHHPNAYETVSPMIVRNKGFNLINGTPNGKHNHFYKKFQSMSESPRWFSQYLTIEDTFDHEGKPLISQEDIDNLRAEGISEESIRQEYYCEWNTGIQGAYYTQEMDRAELEGRICNFDYDPKQPVHTYWDIGQRDATSIWLYQHKGPTIDLVNYIESNNRGPEYYAARLAELSNLHGYHYGRHVGPHDLANATFGTSARSTHSICADHGIFFEIAPRLPVLEGIQAVRAILPKCRFHVEHCALGIDALREYRRKWDPVNKIYANIPWHDWASNGADAFRYLAIDQFKHIGSRQTQRPTRYSISY